MANKGSRVDLWVKAGVDGIRNGGCLACQQVFMILLKKAEKNEMLNFNVKTTTLHKPHAEFKEVGARHLPALVVGEDVYDSTLDEIIEFIDTAFPQNTLHYFNPEADAATRDVFSKFAWFIKEVNKDPMQLEKELRKLNAYLEEDSKLRYICGSSLSHLDCRMMPILHHIRIACFALKNYEIPIDLIGLWRYMKTSYGTEAFIQSCPSDQEIILHWADRPDTQNLSAARHAEISNASPTFSHSVPETINGSI